MQDTQDDAGMRPDYLSFLLRLWRESGEEAVWRASLEDPHTGERMGFASLEALLAFLRQEFGDPQSEVVATPDRTRGYWDIRRGVIGSSEEKGG